MSNLALTDEELERLLRRAWERGYEARAVAHDEWAGTRGYDEQQDRDVHELAQTVTP